MVRKAARVVQAGAAAERLLGNRCHIVGRAIDRYRCRDIEREDRVRAVILDAGHRRGLRLVIESVLELVGGAALDRERARLRAREQIAGACDGIARLTEFVIVLIGDGVIGALRELRAAEPDGNGLVGAPLFEDDVLIALDGGFSDIVLPAILHDVELHQIVVREIAAPDKAHDDPPIGRIDVAGRVIGRVAHRAARTVHNGIIDALGELATQVRHLRDLGADRLARVLELQAIIVGDIGIAGRLPRILNAVVRDGHDHRIVIAVGVVDDAHGSDGESPALIRPVEMGRRLVRGDDDFVGLGVHRFAIGQIGIFRIDRERVFRRVNRRAGRADHRDIVRYLTFPIEVLLADEHAAIRQVALVHAVVEQRRCLAGVRAETDDLRYVGSRILPGHLDAIGFGNRLRNDLEVDALGERDAVELDRSLRDRCQSGVFRVGLKRYLGSRDIGRLPCHLAVQREIAVVGTRCCRIFADGPVGSPTFGIPVDVDHVQGRGRNAVDGERRIRFQAGIGNHVAIRHGSQAAFREVQIVGAARIRGHAIMDETFVVSDERALAHLVGRGRHRSCIEARVHFGHVMRAYLVLIGIVLHDADQTGDIVAAADRIRAHIQIDRLRAHRRAHIAEVRAVFHGTVDAARDAADEWFGRAHAQNEGVDRSCAVQALGDGRIRAGTADDAADERVSDHIARILARAERESRRAVRKAIVLAVGSEVAALEAPAQRADDAAEFARMSGVELGGIRAVHDIAARIARDAADIGCLREDRVAEAVDAVRGRNVNRDLSRVRAIGDVGFLRARIRIHGAIHAAGASDDAADIRSDNRGLDALAGIDLLLRRRIRRTGLDNGHRTVIGATCDIAEHMATQAADVPDGEDDLLRGIHRMRHRNRAAVLAVRQRSFAVTD